MRYKASDLKGVLRPGDKISTNINGDEINPENITTGYYLENNLLEIDKSNKQLSFDCEASGESAWVEIHFFDKFGYLTEAQEKELIKLRKLEHEIQSIL